MEGPAVWEVLAAPVTQTSRRYGCGSGLLFVGVCAQVVDLVAPAHDTEVQDPFKYVTWADDLFLFAKHKAEAQEIASEVADT